MAGLCVIHPQRTPWVNARRMMPWTSDGGGGVRPARPTDLEQLAVKPVGVRWGQLRYLDRPKHRDDRVIDVHPCGLDGFRREAWRRMCEPLIAQRSDSPLGEYPDRTLIDLGHHAGECLRRAAFRATECALDIALSTSVGISAGVDPELPRVVASLSHGACYGASYPFCPSRLADCTRMDGQMDGQLLGSFVRDLSKWPLNWSFFAAPTVSDFRT
jgi:hypothetical protein